MATDNNLPTSGVSDSQSVTVPGPDGLTSNFQYDSNTNTFYIRDGSVVIPPFHGQTHIAEDPIPNATTDTPGLLSADDKAKLDALLQTRIGILGYQGAGFPDDGGFLQGDIILAAGSEFISIERVGNVVRFTAESTIPLNCNIEECAQIYWIQDETDTSSIRPPSCAGKLPGINSYGEMKVYLMPENLVFNPSNPTSSLSTKGNNPSFVFKRYDDGILPNLAEFEMVLERNTNTTTKVGWAMTPGPTGIPECVWFMGLDDDGAQITFELNQESEPGLLGSILYNGNSITRQKAVIVDYPTDLLTTNMYTCKYWDTLGESAKGENFNATNIWRYNNPESSSTSISSTKELVLDSSESVLPVGTLVDIWEFKVAELGSNQRIVRRYFSKEPNTSASNLWSLGSVVRFGDTVTGTMELQPGANGEVSGQTDSALSGIDRTFDRATWGITGFEDPLFLADDGNALSSVGEWYYVDVVGEVSTLPLPNVQMRVSGAIFPIVSTNTLEGSILRFDGLGGVLQLDSIQDKDFEILEDRADGATQLITIFGMGPNELSLLIAQAGTTVTGGSIYTATSTGQPSGIPVNNRFVASVDEDRKAMVVENLFPGEDRENPVFLWNRENGRNFLVESLIGAPTDSVFPPVDILLRAPADSYDDRYFQVIERGHFTAGPFKSRAWIKITGVSWHDMPRAGTIRTLSGIYRDRIWNYTDKVAFYNSSPEEAFYLVGPDETEYNFDLDFIPGDTDDDAQLLGDSDNTDTPAKTTVAQLLHEDYSAPCVRIEFSVNSVTEQIQIQFKVGILSIGTPYELDKSTDPSDNYVRGFLPGSYSVSPIYTQDGFISAENDSPETNISGFAAYTGGDVLSTSGGTVELWNRLKIMYKEEQVWIWWNNLLVVPDQVLTSQLEVPITVANPYFPISNSFLDYPVGKAVFRLWPGAVVKMASVKTQLEQFNEFTNGQLEFGQTSSDDGSSSGTSDSGSGSSSGTSA